MMSMSLVSFLYRSDLQFVNWFVLSSSSSKNLSAKLFLSGLHSCSFNPYQILRKKMKFSIRDFFSKCDQIRRRLRIWSHLLKKSLMENFIFLCEVNKSVCATVKAQNFQVLGCCKVYKTTKKYHSDWFRLFQELS